MVPAASSLSLPSLESNIQSVFNGHLESLIKFQLGLRFSLLAWLISDSAGCEVGGGGGFRQGRMKHAVSGKTLLVVPFGLTPLGNFASV